MVAGWPHLSYTVDKRILSLGQRLIILSQPLWPVKEVISFASSLRPNPASPSQAWVDELFLHLSQTE